MRRAAALLLTFAAFAGCSDDGNEAASSATTAKATTTTTAVDGPVNAAAYVESGDYVNGRHPAYIKTFSETSITFDAVEFLVGDAAAAAWEPTESDPTPPNDYVIRNQNARLRTLPVSGDVVIRVNNTGGYEPSDPNEGHEVNAFTFASYGESDSGYGLFWLTIEGGEVTAIEEQYLP